MKKLNDEQRYYLSDRLKNIFSKKKKNILEEIGPQPKREDFVIKLKSNKDISALINGEVKICGHIDFSMHVNKFIAPNQRYTDALNEWGRKGKELQVRIDKMEEERQRVLDVLMLGDSQRLLDELRDFEGKTF